MRATAVVLALAATAEALHDALRSDRYAALVANRTARCAPPDWGDGEEAIAAALAAREYDALARLQAVGVRALRKRFKDLPGTGIVLAASGSGHWAQREVLPVLPRGAARFRSLVPRRASSPPLDGRRGAAHRFITLRVNRHLAAGVLVFADAAVRAVAAPAIQNSGLLVADAADFAKGDRWKEFRRRLKASVKHYKLWSLALAPFRTSVYLVGPRVAIRWGSTLAEDSTTQDWDARPCGPGFALELARGAGDADVAFSRSSLETCGRSEFAFEHNSAVAGLQCGNHGFEAASAVITQEGRRLFAIALLAHERYLAAESNHARDQPSIMVALRVANDERAPAPGRLSSPERPQSTRRRRSRFPGAALRIKDLSPAVVCRHHTEADAECGSCVVVHHLAQGCCSRDIAAAAPAPAPRPASHHSHSSVVSLLDRGPSHSHSKKPEK